jgi:fluoride ion exporter CrcB/FEX
MLGVLDMRFISVALGGALGALGRYLISLLPVRTEFPVLTLLTNIIGAMVIGFVNVMSREQVLSLYLNGIKNQYDYILIDCMGKCHWRTGRSIWRTESI